MTIQIETNRIVAREIGREIVLDIGKGRRLEIYKFAIERESSDEYDAGWEFDSDESRELFGTLSEDRQDEITDFIDGIEL